MTESSPLPSPTGESLPAQSSQTPGGGRQRAKIKDLMGKRFGRLYVLHFAGLRRRSDGRNLATWHCACDCGSLATVAGKSLLSGKTLSCGCLGIEHRRTSLFKHGEAVIGKLTREYMVWRNMVGRCTDPKNKSWARYGGRGISICPAWKNYASFLSDMGRCPPGLTLNRKDNDGPYCKENCNWATLEEQANNTRRNRFIEIEGVKMTVSQWARKFGIHRGSITSRLNRGLTGMEAIRGQT